MACQPPWRVASLAEVSRGGHVAPRVDVRGRREENLKNLMLWHIMGYTINADGRKEKMACRNVPVMAILKKFRAMADGVRGRKAHRPQQVPKYEYEKHRAPIKVGKD